jgi:hypothetical protein
MMDHTPPVKYTLAYRVLLVVAIPCLLAAAVMTADILLNPLQPDAYFGSVAYRLLTGLLFAPLTILVGVLCVRHSPGNIVGLLLLVIGTGESISSVRNDLDPLLINVVVGIIIPLFWGAYLLLLLYFPDGKPYFRRTGTWMGRAWMLVFGIVWLLNVLPPPTLHYSAINTNNNIDNTINNPFYVRGLDSVVPVGSAIAGIFASVYLLFVVVSLVARYRSGSLRERHQLKWLLAGGVIWMAPQAIIPVVPNLPEAVTSAVSTYGILGAGILPVLTIGPAILLNNLWDIDVIIRRTLIYTVLTVSLGLIYWGGVVGLQSLLRPITGEGNDLAIVATTLAVAGIFLPLRRLVQRVIDRRFYRRKYDAAQTLAAFSTHTRDEVELDRLTGRLVEVVGETMQPEHVSLWLRAIPSTGKPLPVEEQS